jgi:hypothetical protein
MANDFLQQFGNQAFAVHQEVIKIIIKSNIYSKSLFFVVVTFSVSVSITRRKQENVYCKNKVN